MNKTRLEAYSDGVFAIIITIMVLELKVPEGTDWGVIKHLLPVLASYVLSFLYIAIYWGNHHHLLHTAKRVTPGIIWANMHLLFWLSLIPFCTGWMGVNKFESKPVAVYGTLLALCGAAYAILRRVISNTHKDDKNFEKVFVKSSAKEKWSILLYSTSVVIAIYVHPAISVAIYMSVAIIWLVPGKEVEEALDKIEPK
jgi:uncharacterized membrane protein